MAEGVSNTKCPMIVQGCGIDAVNGVYEQDGTNDGVPQYSKLGRWKGKEEEFSLLRCDTEGEGEKMWVISILCSSPGPGTENEDTDFYYVIDNALNVLPPKKGWKKDSNGVKPTPNVLPVQVASPAPKTTPKQTAVIPPTSPTVTASRTSSSPTSLSQVSRLLPNKTATANQATSIQTITSSQTSHSQVASEPTATQPESDMCAEDIDKAAEDDASHNEGNDEGDSGTDSDADREFDAENDDESSSGIDDDESISESDDDEDDNDDARKKPRKMIAKQPTRPRGSMKSSLGGYECWREFMDKLLEGGVDRYIDLPMIAVMGDTSSGKSSLLSNISFVELPSSDTLTTRCPISLFLLYASFPHFLLKVCQFSILFPRSQTGLLVGLLVDPMVQEKVCQEFEVNLFLAYFFRATAYVGCIDSYVHHMGH